MDNIRQMIAVDMGDMMIRIRELEFENKALKESIALKDRTISNLNSMANDKVAKND